MLFVEKNMRYAWCLAVISVCQPAQEPLRFEVASVRMRQPGSPISMVGGAPSGSWAGIQRDRTRLDDATRRFDVTAKAEGDKARSPEEFRQMLRALLGDRFHLTLRRETRDTPVYALVTDKNGPKCHESAPDAKGILRMHGGGRITASGGTMAQLASWFSNANGVDRPVIDQTGLRGRYDFTLEWSNPLDGAQDGTNPSIFTALREQIGLKLEARRAPVEVFVIDRTEMPSEN
jgi:uncharacterized protein (TIGR03435 family)